MFTLTNLVLSGILTVNSVAILNEERFLARSKGNLVLVKLLTLYFVHYHIYSISTFTSPLVGWGKDSISQSSSYQQPQQHNPNSYGVNYDSGNVSVKHQLINLISATRTLMRSKKELLVWWTK